MLGRREVPVDLEELFEQTRRAFSAQVVLGEPVVSGAVTLIPAVAVRGGGGGGGGGGGFGLNARPVGAWVIRGDDVRWQPAVDAGRVALAGIALLALAVWRLGAR
jgi:uncharacterized spore protein YtfJ